MVHDKIDSDRDGNETPPHGDTFAVIEGAVTAAGLFANWPVELVGRMVQSARLRRYDRGASIPTGQGPERRILLVVSGLLEVSQVATAGRRFLLGLIGAGETTGFIRLFGDAAVEYGYFVRERCTVVHLQCEEMLACLGLRPALWQNVAQEVLNRHVRVLGSVLEQVVVGTADQRIAATLNRLALAFGVESSEGVTIRLRLSQDDLADMLCVSRQTVNKELRRLEEAGVIASRYNTVTILNREALAGIVGRR